MGRSENWKLMASGIYKATSIESIYDELTGVKNVKLRDSVEVFNGPMRFADESLDIYEVIFEKRNICCQFHWFM